MVYGIAFYSVEYRRLEIRAACCVWWMILFFVFRVWRQIRKSKVTVERWLTMCIVRSVRVP